MSDEQNESRKIQAQQGEGIATAPTARLFPLKRLAIDLAIAGAFWIFMSGVLRAHVPSSDPFWVTFWSAATALCLSGVFFMALQMWRLVRHDGEE